MKKTKQNSFWRPTHHSEVFRTAHELSDTSHQTVNVKLQNRLKAHSGSLWFLKQFSNSRVQKKKEFIFSVITSVRGTMTMMGFIHSFFLCFHFHHHKDHCKQTLGFTYLLPNQTQCTPNALQAMIT